MFIDVFSSVELSYGFGQEETAVSPIVTGHNPLAGLIQKVLIANNLE